MASSMFSKLEFPSAKVVISAAACAAGTAMFVRTFARNFIPDELGQYFYSKFRQSLATLSNEITFVIDEYDGLNKNQLFHEAEIYVGTIGSPSVKTYRASLRKKEKKIEVSIGGDEEIMDDFCGIQMKWRLISKKIEPRSFRSSDSYYSSMISEERNWQLSFDKKHKIKVVNEYLPYILERSEALKEERKTLKLHTQINDHGARSTPWQSVNLDHPAKFEMLAMDLEIKNLIVDDLDRFLKRRKLYRKVGKAWKRGYLLFGPPGTGKSSLIAAVANHLNIDVYDLELSCIKSNSDFRRLLITTANRSILVVEDIDASIDLSKRKNKRAAPLPSFYTGYSEPRK